MGHDVHIIGRHQLDTSSIGSLARDLSSRFHTGVTFGYYDIFDFGLEGDDRTPPFQYVALGKIEHPNADRSLWLTDEFYLLHMLIEKYGNQVYDLSWLKQHGYVKSEIDEAINSVCFELRDNTNDVDYGTIYNDTFHDFYNYYHNRWWSFCKAFTENNDGVFLEYVNSFRKKVKAFFEKIGGSEVVYLDDQGPTQHWVHSNNNWHTIQSGLKKEFKASTLHIPNFMKQKKRLPSGQYPLAFYDDFSDFHD
jgi:hypothetical protein